MRYLQRCVKCSVINYSISVIDSMHNVFFNFSGAFFYAEHFSWSIYLFICPLTHVGKRENMCQALQCPEDRNMTTLVPAANYKYYSMYSSLPENTTIECIPKAGMFIFSSESLNYTQAQSFCRKRNSSLAHVISEERTEGLVKFVSQNRPSFVGLSNKEGIWKNDFGNWQFFL